MAAQLRPEKLNVRRNDRALFVGATGSGKTTLAKSLLWGQRHVAVLDPKRTFDMPPEAGATITEDPDVVTNWEGPEMIIFRPGLDVLNNPESVDWFFWWAFERGNTLVYIDESAMVTNGATLPRGYAACIQLGRERGVGTWHATQRPARVPIVLLSESEHIFAFRLRHDDDAERVARYSDPRTLERRPVKNQFWYWNDSTQTLRFFDRANVGKVLAK